MTQTTRKNVGQRVRALREQNNLTQEQLALMTGVGRSYLAKVEAGNRNATVDFMEKIALGLGTTLGRLFEDL
ncbi:helix-turn-helix transcriptional regulator [Eggerthella guodeyinii]|uniref:Helix-turn-helix domain-containing protein n=2 Tax=Eggerthella TaxID=84111 RepID=A0A6N7RLE2_9ACTN|nr:MULTISPECIES: helix-turn-helix transcriptional regulator [Eggerthella]MBC5584322.1 helix-turn-helix transcriptional regulator [Eggerthella hominis]MRX82155.1 helix-turn-helix domain-containing protein [Eggerthella guodeyinii]QOS67746.1 helix-turn-helix transcriptional regulator [Eggerthella guodeyinii]